MQNDKIVLIDLPNTLFDSRHRTTEAGLCMVGIKEDTLNYPAYQMYKMFRSAGYHIAFTHYCLHRLRPQVETLLTSHSIPKTSDYIKLYTNAHNQNVIDDKSLKMYVYSRLSEEHDIEYVIDNDRDMQAFWLDKGLGLINVPLPLRYDV